MASGVGETVCVGGTKRKERERERGISRWREIASMLSKLVIQIATRSRTEQSAAEYLTVLITLSMPASFAIAGAEIKSGIPIPY